MLGLDTLDVAIGVILLFLATSLLCTALREMIESIWKSRGTDLERGIKELLQDPEGTATKELYEHPFIYSLYRGAYDSARNASSNGRAITGRSTGGQLPSYIPAGQFSIALLDIVHRAWPYAAHSSMSIQTLRAGAKALPNAKLSKAVLAALDHAQGDVELARKNLEAWYDGTMDRVAGWYKRRTQVVLFVIGLGAAAILNLDAVTVAEHLARDKSLRNAVVAEAQAVSNQPADPPTATVEQLKGELDSIGLPIGWTHWWPAAQTTLVCDADTVATGCKGPLAINCIDIAKLIPCVLHSEKLPGGQHYQLTWGALFSVGIGWLVTAVAVTMGAPFWFDMLNKVMVIRSTVKPTQKSPDEKSTEHGVSLQAHAQPVAIAHPNELVNQNVNDRAVVTKQPFPPGPLVPVAWNTDFKNLGEITL
jgi:hypothetical protein